jgi:hypothetical protein
MAALVCAAAFQLDALERHIAGGLPEYARPAFLRILSHIEVTTTFKLQRQSLVREGYAPTASADAIYFHDRARQAYVPLDAALYERIRAGIERL